MKSPEQLTENGPMPMNIFRKLTFGPKKASEYARKVVASGGRPEKRGYYEALAFSQLFNVNCAIYRKKRRPWALGGLKRVEGFKIPKEPSQGTVLLIRTGKDPGGGDHFDCLVQP